MTNLVPSIPAERPFRHELWNAARYYFSGRPRIILTAATVLGAGAYLNWGWLVALGLAPVILFALPCAAMCALGLCMNGRSHKPSGNASGPQEETGTVQSLRGTAGEAVAKNGSKHGGKGCC